MKKRNVYMVSDSEETENEMLEIKNRVYDDHVSNSEDEKVEVKKRLQVAVKKTENYVSCKDTVSNESKLKRAQCSDAHHK